MNNAPARPLALAAGAAVVGWLGMYVHNLADLPALTLASPENSLPGLLWLVLLALWAALPRKHWPMVVLFAWALLNLVGGVASVLPLPILPFKPEQSLRHYAFHALYASAQLPILFLLFRGVRRGVARSGAA